MMDIGASRKFSLQSRSPPPLPQYRPHGSENNNSDNNTGIDVIQPIKRSKSQSTSSSATKLSSSPSMNNKPRHRSPPPSTSSPIVKSSNNNTSKSNNNITSSSHHLHPAASSHPNITTTSSAMNNTSNLGNSQISETSDDSVEDIMKDLSNIQGLGKARDRTTFKGVFGKMVGSFNGKYSFFFILYLCWGGNCYYYHQIKLLVYFIYFMN